MVESFPENTDIYTKITYRVRGTDTKQDPDSNESYITIEDVSGDVVQARTLMTRDDQGIYSYWWETGAIGKGVFKVIIDGEFTARTYVATDWVELT